MAPPAAAPAPAAPGSLHGHTPVTTLHSFWETNSPRQRRRDAAVIHSLHALEGSVSSAITQLPSCVVLGDQCSGKSSIIEGALRVSIPSFRTHGLRCPLHFQLVNSSDRDQPWQAVVTLNRAFTPDAGSELQLARLYRGWVPSEEPEVIEFARTNNPLELSDLILRAQRATVNPSQPYTTFQPGSEEFKCRPGCSPNVVRISVTHSSIAALSIYELPGLVQWGEDCEVISFVHELAKEYVSNPRSLAVIAIDLDMAEPASTAVGLVAKHGKGRCLGVFTKADCLYPDETTRARVLTSLERGTGPFSQPCHALNPLSQDIFTLPAEAGLEQSFLDFRNFCRRELPWMRWSHVERQVGHFRFLDDLTKAFAGIVVDSVPALRKDITLATPSPSDHATDPIFRIRDIVKDFVEEVKHTLGANSRSKFRRKTWSSLTLGFHNDLLKMTPKMRLSAAKDKDVYHDVHAGARPEASAEDGRDEGDRGSPLAGGTGSSDSGLPVPNARRAYSLDDFVALVERATGQIDTEIQHNMMSLTTREWDQPVQDFLYQVRCHLKSLIRELFKARFRPLKGLPVVKESWDIIDRLVEAKVKHFSDIVGAVLAAEQAGVHIYDRPNGYEQSRRAFHENFIERRVEHRMTVYHAESEREDRGRTTRRSADEERKIKAAVEADPYRVEVDSVSRIAGYHDMSSTRMFDATCLLVDGGLFREIGEELWSHLVSGLGLLQGLEARDRADALLQVPAHARPLENVQLQLAIEQALSEIQAQVGLT